MSRRQPQRRRGGRDAHVDPADAPLTTTVDALLHPERLEEHLSTVLGAAQAHVADSMSDEDEGHTVATKTNKSGKDVSAQNALLSDDAAHGKALAEAQAIFAAGGDAQVQEHLKSEIAVTKKLESELAQIKKKVEAARRQQDLQLADHNKAVAQKDALHNACRALISERERLEKYHAEQTEADEVRREDVKKKFDRDVDSILQKVADQAKQKRETLEENAKLQAEFDELKAQFETMMDDKMREWKEREAVTKELVTDLSAKITEHEAVEAECKLREAEAHEMTLSINAYREQVSTYESRMGDFEAALTKSSEVVELTGLQRTQLEQRIAQLEEAKKTDIAVKKQLEDECNKSKNRIRELRKQITQLEKTKDTAEKKCRAVQEDFRRAAAKAAPATAA